jgi:nucleoside 2-deoxyribosyltransferase
MEGHDAFTGNSFSRRIDVGFMRVYLAAPLFCQAETDFNAKVADSLRKANVEVFLPQENFVAVDGADRDAQAVKAFALDISEIERSDSLVIILDGRVPDEGACFELGFAYARGKPCYGLKTDVRNSEMGGDNIMLSEALRVPAFRSVSELVAHFGGIKEKQ